MKNYWEGAIDGKNYTIQAKTTKVIINGESFQLSKLPYKKQTIFFREIKLPIDEAEVLLAPGINSFQLIVNGRNASTGEVYQSMDKVPMWAYIFFVLHAFNLLNGAIGGMLAFLGIFLTAYITAKPQWGTGKKLLVSVFILLGSIVIIYVVAILLFILFHR